MLTFLDTVNWIMMKKPQYFIRKKNQDEGPSANPVRFWTLLAGATLTLVLILIVAYGIWQVKTIVSRASENWNEIKFAYDKPNIVQAAREDYEQKTGQIDKDFANKQKEEQQAMIDKAAAEITNEQQKLTPTPRF